MYHQSCSNKIILDSPRKMKQFRFDQFKLMVAYHQSHYWTTNHPTGRFTSETRVKNSLLKIHSWMKTFRSSANRPDHILIRRLTRYWLTMNRVSSSSAHRLSYLYLEQDAFLASPVHSSSLTRRVLHKYNEWNIRDHDHRSFMSLHNSQCTNRSMCARNRDLCCNALKNHHSLFDMLRSISCSLPNQHMKIFRASRCQKN